MASTDASSEFTELIERLPQSAASLAQRATSLSEAGKAGDAERALRAGLARHSASVLRVALARVLLLQDRPKEAMAEMVSVLRHEPENPEALLVLASCLLECGEVERGIKMLDKARVAGANVNAIADVEDRHARTLARSTNPNFADRTQDEEFSPTAIRPVPTGALPESRRRQQTLMGRPNPAADLAGLRKAVAAGKRPGAPPPPVPGRRIPPPPLQSGTFAGLDTYDVDTQGVDGSDDDGLDETGISERLSFSAARGASAETATPDEATSHILIDEADLADLSTPGASGSWDRLPSVEYDASFAAEARAARRAHAPPADLDELPAWGTDLPQFDSPHVEPDPTAPDQPRDLDRRFISGNIGRHGGQAVAGMPSLDANVLFDDLSVNDPEPPQPLDIPMKREYTSEPSRHEAAAPAPSYAPSGSHPRPQPHHAPPPAQQYEPHAPSPEPAPNFQLEGNSVPVDQRWLGPQQDQPRREQTAVAAEPRPPAASSSMRFVFEKRWPLVLVLLLAVVLAGFLGLCIASGTSLNSDLEAAIVASNDARASDTYEGYLQAEAQLLEAANAVSFMGGGFDNFVERHVPIPGLGATRLRRNVIADLAVVSALLEHRFESEGAHKAASRVSAAKERAGASPLTAVAAAYLEMSGDRPHVALQILDEAHARASTDTRISEARAWALLELKRPADAANAVESLRGQPGLSVNQKYLLASVDAARGAETASASFAEVFTDSPDHIDSRIGRSYTLRKDAADIVKAQQVLDTVLVQLAPRASRFQKARATSAYGSTYLAAGDEERAEERFRDAIRTMPGRSELYTPLLEFYADEGRTDDLESYLTKARDEGAYAPSLALFEAQLRLMNSEPEKATVILEALDFQDARKLFLEGLALVEARKVDAAVELLATSEKIPGQSVEAQALHDLARALAKPEALEDAIYQLGRLEAKNDDSAIVHWASGATQLLSADATASKSKRKERLESARVDLQRAVELDPAFAPAQFALCEVLVRQLETDKADVACKAGTNVAPRYVPGIVATARLRLAQGRFEDARNLSDAASKARPNDGVVGLLAARVAIEQRRVADAREELDRWIADPADPFEMNLLEGRLQFTRGQYTKAAGYLKRAYEMRPVHGEAAMYYAHTLTRLGEDKTAAQILLDNLSHPTWSGYAWAVLGEARRRQGKLRDAFENFSKASKIYEEQQIAPKYWSHLYSQWALAEKKRSRKWRHPRVLDKLRDGREKGDPDDPEINLMWSRYHLEKRRPDNDAAIKSLRRVVAAAPYHCDAFEALRTLYMNEDRDSDLEKLEETRDPDCPAPDLQKSGKK